MYEYSGGFNGIVGYPDGSHTVVFTRKGICKTIVHGRLENKRKFTLAKSSLKNGSKNYYEIKYTPYGLGFNKQPLTTQRLEFIGMDTLIIYDPCCDLFQYNYVRE